MLFLLCRPTKGWYESGQSSPHAEQIVAVTVASVMLLLGGVLYSLPPDQMAVHWNAAGDADGTTTKLIVVYVLIGRLERVINGD